MPSSLPQNLKPKRTESARQIGCKIVAIIIGLMVPGLTGWASSAYLPTFSDWVDEFISSKLTPDGSYVTSWPWVLFLVPSVALLVYYLLVLWGWTVIHRDPGRARLWIIVLPITMLTLATVLHYPGTQLMVAVTASIATLTIIVGLWPSTPEQEPEFNDELYRTFFSLRICELLKEADPPICRIAILGSWGEGKTSLLKLVQSTLNESKSPKFATAWVNPWGAQTREEAWDILASGLDLAISDSLLPPRGWYRNPWIKAFVSLIPGESLGKRMLDAASTHLTQDGEAELARIDKKLSKRKERVVIIVDDMERAEPEVIRSVLPVIDSLTKLENCSFIFAIDPERMERAFASKDRFLGKWTAQISTNAGVVSNGDVILDPSMDRSELYGYLDKVMDLILELPEPTHIQIQEWANKQIRLIASRCPKLNQAFPRIVPLLPTNPRDCLKFMKFAEQIETLFLQYYRDDEKNFLALFFVLLGESLFPGFRKALASDTSWEKSFEAHGFMGEGNLRDTTEVSDLVLKMTQEIRSAKVELHEDRLRGIITGIGSQVGMSALGSGYPPADAQWVTAGFMQRLHLTTSEMDEVAQSWLKNAGKKPLSLILSESLTEKGIPPAAHISETLQQIVEHQINSVSDQTRDARRNENINLEGVQAKLQKAITILNAFKNQFKSKIETDGKPDCEALSEQVVELFTNLIERDPVTKDQSEIWQNLRKAREDAMSSVVCSLPWHRLRSVMLSPTRTQIDLMSPGELKIAAISELATVDRCFKEFLVGQFLQKMNEATASGFPDFVIEQTSPVRVLEPDRWIPYDKSGDFDLVLLKELITIAATSPAINRWVCWTINTWLLEPVILNTHRSEEFSETLGQWLVGHQRYRKFINVFWEAAINGNNQQEIQKLLKNRELLFIQSSADPPPGGISIDIVNEVYPLPNISNQVSP
jgi:KAP family P-loop domain